MSRPRCPLCAQPLEDPRTVCPGWHPVRQEDPVVHAACCPQCRALAAGRTTITVQDVRAVQRRLAARKPPAEEEEEP